MYFSRFRLKDQSLRRDVDISEYPQSPKTTFQQIAPDASEFYIGRNYISFLSDEKHETVSELFEPVPSTFYAGVYDYVKEGKYPYRRGIRFEMTPIENLDPFLNEEFKNDDVSFTGPLNEVFTAFRKEGLPGDTFQDIKSKYLGELKVYDLEIYFDDFSIEYFPMNSWYYVSFDELPFGNDFYSLAADAATEMDVWRDCTIMAEKNTDDFSNYYLECYNSKCIVSLLNDTMQQKFRMLFELAPVKSKAGPKVEFVQGTTQFTSAILYDVGQALCVGIFSQDAHGADVLECFFDFGVPVVAKYIHTNWAADFGTIQNLMAGAYQQDRTINIFLSHLHKDHFIMYCPLQDYLSSTHWSAPNYAAQITPQMLRNDIEANGGTLDTFDGVFNEIPTWDNPDLLASKMDYTPVGGPHDHAHHHCIYAQLRLASGRTVFLSGDCTYNAVPANQRSGMPTAAGPRTGYNYLQASHHGGDYHLPPAVANDQDIPDPAPGIPNHPTRVIYSCNPHGNNFRHPLAASVADYTAKGWIPANSHNTRWNNLCLMT